MQYSIRHVTQFSYATPISQSIMEVRTCPRTDAQQQCYAFELNLTPHAQLFSYQDFMGNIVHHFDIPSKHDELSLESFVPADGLIIVPTKIIDQANVDAFWDELKKRQGIQ